jgi:hypothetical protein
MIIKEANENAKQKKKIDASQDAHGLVGAQQHWRDV